MLEKILKFLVLAYCILHGQVEPYLKDLDIAGLAFCLGDGQTEAYLKHMGMTGLASVWAMARRRPV